MNPSEFNVDSACGFEPLYHFNRVIFDQNEVTEIRRT